MNDVRKLNYSYKNNNNNNNYRIENMNFNKNYNFFDNNFWECPRCHNSKNSKEYNLCKICGFENENIKGF